MYINYSDIKFENFYCVFHQDYQIHFVQNKWLSLTQVVIQELKTHMNVTGT